MVALRFGVSVSSAVKWSQRYRSTGSVAPGKMGGHRKPVLDPHRAFIAKRLNQTPHLTLHALKDELAARGVKVSHNAVWLFLRREGLRFKKTLFALEQGRSDVARRRRRWRSWQASLDPRRLVFIDETWIKTFETSRLGARSGVIGGRPSDADALTLLIKIAGFVLSSPNFAQIGRPPLCEVPIRSPRRVFEDGLQFRPRAWAKAGAILS